MNALLANLHASGERDHAHRPETWLLAKMILVAAFDEKRGDASATRWLNGQVSDAKIPIEIACLGWDIGPKELTNIRHMSLAELKRAMNTVANSPHASGTVAKTSSTTCVICGKPRKNKGGFALRTDGVCHHCHRKTDEYRVAERARKRKAA